ncbi:hypothetical protein AA0473_1618 [Acetobacter orleanensis NRIC 0473]|uniref:Uncharacterized protein n=1 Tax=Acetobacter orleanensis TaxID=104099 RepID=A0A4Y3TH29_9PROT|nr:hypothetical protein Abol_021_110 [Acetobacter orleanensis JCM 7639]GBR28036.1 hypothetical protein AA0473_1618 [Acetobacter orleanensis NRIC 0473]GEB82271.1 hypothetical protein AOR01nite_07480 [Acetobacter orleanensis]
MCVMMAEPMGMVMSVMVIVPMVTVIMSTVIMFVVVVPVMRTLSLPMIGRSVVAIMRGAG